MGWLVRPGAYRLVLLLLAGLGVFGLAGVTLADDWPQYGHDANHSGANGGVSSLSVATAPSLSLRWSFPTGGVIADSPAVANGTVYFGSWDGNLYALDAATGTLKWKSYLGITASAACDPSRLGVSSGPAVANGVVYVGGGDGYFYALNASNGQTLWRVLVGNDSAGNYNWSSPSLLGNGILFLGVASLGDCPLVAGKVLEIDTNQQEVVATANLVRPGFLGGGVWTSPASLPTGGTVFVTDGNAGASGDNSALAPALLALSWNGLTISDGWEIPAAQQVVDSDWSTSPVPFQTSTGAWRIGAADKNGLYYAFDTTNLGQGPVWETNIAIGGPDPQEGEGSISTAAYDGAHLYVAGGSTTIQGTAYSGAVRALDPDNGSIIWQEGTNQGPILGGLATSNGLLVDGAGATLEVRDTSDGNLLYSFGTGAQIYGAAAVANSWLYVGSTDASLYAFSLPPAMLPTLACPTSVPTPFPSPSASAPVTFGFNALGTTIETSGANVVRGSRISAAATGLVGDVKVYLASIDPSSPAIQVAIYTDNGGVPGSLLGVSSSFNPSATGWQTIPTPDIPVQNGQAYWLLFNVAGKQTAGIWTDGAPEVGWSGGETFGSWPANKPPGSPETDLYSIAAVLDESSGNALAVIRPPTNASASIASQILLPDLPIALPPCQ
jgi:outer membrane protein assembly factor BamB